MALVRVKDIFPKKVPYKIIETAGVQNPPESCFDKAPSADGKALGDPENRIKRIEIEEGVTTIGYYAFHGFSSLVSVKLPSTLKIISSDAFSFCTSLEEIDIPEGVERILWDAFTGCYSLKKVRLPSTLKDIRESAFSYCTSLSEITLPEGLEILDAKAFYNCTSLRRIEIPGSVRQIKSCTFVGCSSLSEVIINEGVETIDIYAFFRCCALERIHFPKSLNKIETVFFEQDPLPFSDTLFYKSITGDFIIINDILIGYKGSAVDIVIPDGVKQIGPHVFYGRSSIQTVTFPVGLKRIEECAFTGCTSLLGAELPDSLEHLDSCAFEKCTSLKSVKLPGSIKRVAFRVFGGCTSLYRAELCSGIEKIDPEAFFGCTSLSELLLPDGVYDINISAFCGCTSLLELSIPKSVECIGSSAFKNTPWYDHLSKPAIVGDHLLMTCEIEAIDGRKTAVIPDDVREITFDLGISLENDEVFDFKFRGCRFTYHTYYYRGDYGYWYLTHFINETIRAAASKSYGDEAVDLTQEERFDIAYTVWEQTGQREARDYLNAHGREFFLHAVDNLSER